MLQIKKVIYLLNISLINNIINNTNTTIPNTQKILPFSTQSLKNDVLVGWNTAPPVAPAPVEGCCTAMLNDDVDNTVFPNFRFTFPV